MSVSAIATVISVLGSVGSALGPLAKHITPLLASGTKEAWGVIWANGGKDALEKWSQAMFSMVTPDKFGMGVKESEVKDLAKQYGKDHKLDPDTAERKVLESLWATDPNAYPKSDVGKGDVSHVMLAGDRDQAKLMKQLSKDVEGKDFKPVVLEPEDTIEVMKQSNLLDEQKHQQYKQDVEKDGQKKTIQRVMRDPEFKQSLKTHIKPQRMMIQCAKGKKLDEQRRGLTKDDPSLDLEKTTPVMEDL